MKIFTNKSLWLTLMPLVFVFAFGANSAKAQNAATQGLNISPFLLERKMEKGETSNEIIDITNISDRALPVVISINDFIPSGDNGQQMYVDPGKGDPRFSLSSWITINSNPKPTLQPGEKTSLNFSITPPLDAEEGGHYGAILFSFETGTAQGTAVAVQQKLGAIILVKLGKVTEAGQLVNFGTEKTFYEYPPVNFTATFKNLGNVHVKPRGSISITNMFGRKIASVLMNENANNVLANTERTFKTVWDGSFGFGRYSANMKLVYGDSGQVVNGSVSFWIIPWKIILGAALALFLLVLIVVFAVKRYNKWLLEKAYAVRERKE